MRLLGLWAADLSRGELFSILSLLGFANGIIIRVTEAIVHQGFWGALNSTFNISALIWIAFYICPTLMVRAPAAPLEHFDVAVASLAALTFILPVHWLSWIALTGLAIYILFGQRAATPALDRGAWVLLAVTGAMFWGRVLMLVASDLVLQADAILVSWLTWTSRLDNVLESTDGSGYVWLGPGCSSLVNVSLAFLCWVLFAQCRGLRWSLPTVGWCLLACLAVVSINVVRISLVVLHSEYYGLVHGTVGSSMAGWLTAVITVAICHYGARRERLAQA